MKKVNMKKAAVIGICCAIVSTSTVFAVSNSPNLNENIKIQINNEWMQLRVKPYIENDRTLVSLNEFMEKLGAKVESDLNEGTIKISYEDASIELTVGKHSAKIIKNNGGELKKEEINLEIAPKAVDENVFIPLRFAAENLGFDVEWDNSLRAVIIKDEGTIMAEGPAEFVTEVTEFVQSFGEQLKMVSLLAPEDVIRDAMVKYYGDYVSSDLIEKWVKDSKNAPGRQVSSPWPERIDILSAEKTSENEYIVEGTIIEITSVELKEGGSGAKRQIILKIKRTDDKFMIVDAELGDYEE